MTNLIIGLAVFIAVLYFVENKLGVSKQNTYALIAGGSLFSVMDAITRIILGAMSLSPEVMLTGLVMALISGFFFNIFAKRSGLL